MPFPQAPAGARRIHGGWWRSGWLWCRGRSCWGCSIRMNKRSSPVGSSGGGSWRTWQIWLAWDSLSSQSRSGLSGSCRTYTSSPPSHAFTVVCETLKSLAICRIGRWGVSSVIAWTFSMNSLVRVFLAVSFRSTTSKGSSDALSSALKRRTVRICILRVLAMVLLS